MTDDVSPVMKDTKHKYIHIFFLKQIQDAKG